MEELALPRRGVARVRPHLEVVAAGCEDALVNGELVLADDDVDVAKCRRLAQLVQSGEGLENINNVCYL